ncbi:unnamed protein product [Rhodiola kirilowii]
MAAGRISLQTYTIPANSLTIQVGEIVLVRPDRDGALPFVAKIERIYADPDMTGAEVSIRWYYRPEDTFQGRRLFHGLKELFCSDHSEEIFAECIDGKCNVHSFDDYQQLELVRDVDYFTRFNYIYREERLVPDQVEVFCLCGMPVNPDLRMILCEGCLEWFHLLCLNMSLEETRRISHFYCQSCSPTNNHDRGSHR